MLIAAQHFAHKPRPALPAHQDTSRQMEVDGHDIASDGPRLHHSELLKLVSILGAFFIQDLIALQAEHHSAAPRVVARSTGWAMR